MIDDPEQPEWFNKLMRSQQSESEPPVLVQPVVSKQRMKTKTFDDAVEIARGLMLDAGKAAAEHFGGEPPTLREEKTLTGLRLVLVWPDGEETNECVIQLTGDQTSHAC